MASAREMSTWGPPEEDINNAGEDEHTAVVAEEEDGREHDDDEDEHDTYGGYGRRDDIDVGDAGMESDLAGALDEAELWFGQELVSFADEFSLTDRHMVPTWQEDPTSSYFAEDVEDYGSWPSSPSRRGDLRSFM